MYSLILNNLTQTQKQNSDSNREILERLYWLNSLCLFSFQSIQTVSTRIIGNAGVVDDEKLLNDLQFLMDQDIIQNASIRENEFSFFLTDNGIEMIREFDICFQSKEIEDILFRE